MIFINRPLTLTTIFPLLLMFCFSHKVLAGKSITKSALNTSSMAIHLKEVSGWNHLETDAKLQEIIKNGPAAYKILTKQIIDKNKISINISTVLARKLANWHQQHSNGIKINLIERELSFGQFKGLNFAITIHHVNSVQPSIEQAQDYYMEEIETGSIELQWLTELLSKPPELTLTLFGTNHDNQNIATPMATFNYKIVPTDNKNIVNISSDSFSYYWQKNYQEEMVSKDILANYKIYGMLFTLDTSTNKTLRSFMSSEYKQDFPKTINELFLELPITIEDPIIKVSLNKVNNN